jgi:hypothetical protein
MGFGIEAVMFTRLAVGIAAQAGENFATKLYGAVLLLGDLQRYAA